MIFLKLFYEFFKIGLFSIGGGNATIPFLLKLSDSTSWYSRSDLFDMIAISESTPGAIGVNMSTFVGYRVIFSEFNSIPLAILGGLTSTLGLVAPSIIIIIIVANILTKFKDNKHVNNIFYALRAASCALIGYATYTLLTLTVINIDLYNQTNSLNDLFNLKAIIYGVILTFFVFKYKKHPVFYILISAVVGILFIFI